METGEIEATPSLDKVLQNEALGAISVPVRLDEAMEVHLLPNRRVQYSTTAIAASPAAPVQVVPGTPKRGAGMLIATGGDVLINTKDTGGGMQWPAGVPYPFRHAQAIYVSAVTAAVTVGCAVELWAD